jgi:hypothetical protein
VKPHQQHSGSPARLDFQFCCYSFSNRIRAILTDALSKSHGSLIKRLYGKSIPPALNTPLREAIPDLAATRRIIKGHIGAVETTLAAGPACEQIVSPMVAKIPPFVRRFASPDVLCTRQ